MHQTQVFSDKRHELLEEVPGFSEGRSKGENTGGGPGDIFQSASAYRKESGGYHKENTDRTYCFVKGGFQPRRKMKALKWQGYILESGLSEQIFKYYHVYTKIRLMTLVITWKIQKSLLRSPEKQVIP